MVFEEGSIQQYKRRREVLPVSVKVDVWVVTVRGYAGH